MNEPIQQEEEKEIKQAQEVPAPSKMIDAKEVLILEESYKDVEINS